MKNKKNYEQHLQEIKRTKELLPFHKMDEFSRRSFIQSVGVFLAGLSVPSMIRFEKMSDLSRKILGNSMAFAQGPGSKSLDINIYMRAGYQSSTVVGMQGHDGVVPVDINMPWVNGITSTATSGNPVILPPNAQSLVPFAGAIQHIVGDNSTGHTEYFQSCQRPGMGELLSLRAATEDDAGYTPLLSTPFVFGSNQNVAVQDVPSSLASFTPITFNNVASAYQQFTPLTLTTGQGNSLSNTLRNSLLGIIGNKFQDDITKGVLQKDSALIKSSGEQTLKILKTNYADALNPANDAATVNAISAGVGSQGQINTNAATAAQMMYVLIKAAVLGITPMTGGIIWSAGDWHNFNALAAGDGSGDQRSISGAFLATLIANVLTLASNNTWENPSGGNLEIRIHLHSEFGRTILLGGALNDDNGDGQSDFSLVLGSKVNQTDFKPGCFGGTTTTGQEAGFNTSTGNHSSNIALASPDVMFGHKLNLLRIKKDLFNLSNYAGFSGNMA